MIFVIYRAKAEAAASKPSYQDLEARIQDLMSKGDAALEYARHTDGCASNVGAWGDPIPACTCGFAEARKAWIRA